MFLSLRDILRTGIGSVFFSLCFIFYCCFVFVYYQFVCHFSLFVYFCLFFFLTVQSTLEIGVLHFRGVCQPAEPSMCSGCQCPPCDPQKFSKVLTPGLSQISSFLLSGLQTIHCLHFPFNVFEGQTEANWAFCVVNKDCRLIEPQ